MPHPAWWHTGRSADRAGWGAEVFSNRAVSSFLFPPFFTVRDRGFHQLLELLELTQHRLPALLLFQPVLGILLEGSVHARLAGSLEENLILALCRFIDRILDLVLAGNPVKTPKPLVLQVDLLHVAVLLFQILHADPAVHPPMGEPAINGGVVLVCR